MRKRNYEFWNPKTDTTVVLSPKKSNRVLEGRFIHQAARLNMGDYIWLHTGERVKCIQ
jgi:hypothetical protein